MEFITLFFLVFWGWVNSYFAQKRGRNPYGWFFLGVLFGPFPLIVLFLIPALEITKQEPQTLEVEGIRISHHAPFDQHDWYYLDDKRLQSGPHTFAELRNFLNKEQISEKTYVWNETMTEWKKIKDLSDFHKALKS